MLTPQKQRRSNIDWSEHLPPRLAIEQNAYERCMTALAMRQAGLMFKEIAEAFGISSPRAQQIVHKGERLLAQRPRRSPAERYFAGEIGLIEPTEKEKRKLAVFFPQPGATQHHHHSPATRG
jgi:hypothetical protein